MDLSSYPEFTLRFALGLTEQLGATVDVNLVNHKPFYAPPHQQVETVQAMSDRYGDLEREALDDLPTPEVCCCGERSHPMMHNMYDKPMDNEGERSSGWLAPGDEPPPPPSDPVMKPPVEQPQNAPPVRLPPDGPEVPMPGGPPNPAKPPRLPPPGYPPGEVPMPIKPPGEPLLPEIPPLEVPTKLPGEGPPPGLPPEKQPFPPMDRLVFVDRGVHAR